MEISEKTDREIELNIEEDILSLFDDCRKTGYYADEPELVPLEDFTDFSVEEIEDALSLYFRFFDREEKDLIFLNFIGRKTQVDLVGIFDKSQPALCCDRRRILRELVVIRRLHDAYEEVFDFLADDSVKITRMERNLLAVFFYALSLTKTASVVGVNPMICRVRLRRTIERLKKLEDRRAEKIGGYFEYIMNNLNSIRREVPEQPMKKVRGRRDFPSGYVTQELSF